ncbi:MAG TPA: alpha/beta hydrolase [Jiangellales bacterium]|nr:alpha/beta hydrolase [Jiangellales bacterium]
MNDHAGQDAAPSGQQPPAGIEVRLPSGVSLFVRHTPAERPDAPPALLVHGLGGSSLNWIGLMPELADVVEQWAVDLPGFGESPPARLHTIDSFVNVIIEFIEQIGRAAHVIANSMGGMISVLTAARRPDLVASLTLISPAMPHFLLPSTARAMAILAMPKVGERLLARINDVTPEEQVRRIAGVLFGDPNVIDPDGYELAVVERTRRMEQGYGDAVLLEALRSIVRYYAVPPWRSVWSAAQRVSCPTLVVLGAMDSLVGSSTAKRWRRTVPHAHVMTMRSTGHVAMMEKPAEVAELIRAYLIPGRGSQ